MYKVIAFDLDGTLIDSVHDIANSMNAVLKDNNLPLHSVEKYKSFIGEGAYQLVQKALNYTGDIDSYFEQYKKYALINCVNAKEFNNVSDTLLKLKDNYKLAVITNKPIDQATKAIEHYFPNIFDYVLGQKEDVAKKPNKEPMDILLNHFNISNKEVLYVGDSHIDFEFASNCNTDVLILTYGYSKEGFMDTLDSKYKINEFKELLLKL